MADAAHSRTHIAYLADGRLFLKVGEAAPTEILCTYAENLKERTAKLHLQNDWKHTDGGAMSDALVLGVRTLRRYPAGNHDRRNCPVRQK